MYRHILVPTDGSALSEKAVRHAIALAKSTGARVTAFHATPSYPRPVYTDAMVQDADVRKQYASAASREAASVLSPIERSAASEGVHCEVVHAVADAPWQAILDAAHRHKCDVIVMASHGRRGMAALLLGSETVKVLTHAKVPVVVVR
jgi:nucleotide-binding universal stress UspA family protein